MRKLTFALAIGLLIGATAFFAGTPKQAAAAAGDAKVVIVVGATQGATSSYRSDADAAASVFAGYTSNITKVYSPNATWSAVKAAAKGANVLIYLGHGNGYPNPYVSYLQPLGDSGMGLNASAGAGDSNTKYYGEAYMAQLELAPNALVILNHLCYASGDSEPGHGNPTETVAKTRVENYASGFMRGGASAVLAEGIYDISYYIHSLFGASQSIDSMWRNSPSFHDNVKTWTSTRNPSATAEIDPDYEHPAGDGDVYYRSLVIKPGVTTAQVISGTAAPFVPASGSYYPISPTRVIDTRYGAAGPTGVLLARGVVNYQISGGVVPSSAIAITANVTVTGQQANGWLYVAPEITGTPPASTVNFLKGDNRANGITVGLSPRGTVAVWYGASPGNTTNFIIDVTGYFLPGTAGAGYNSFGPQRVLDTRDGTGLSGKFGHGQYRKIQVAGVDGLPASGIVAVAGNITIVKPSYKGYVFLGPDPTNSPGSSTINFPAGDIRANNVIVPVNADGTVSATYVAVAGATVDVILDISGYYTATGGKLFNTVAPARILDSRNGTGLTGPFTAKTAKTLQVSGNGGVPSGASALVGNLTVTEQTTGGVAVIGPTVDPSATFSNLNFPRGDNRANGFTVPLTGDGKVQLIFVAGTGTAQLIVDVNGYYMGNA